MICIPDLPCDEDIFPLADPRCDSFLETGTDLGFVAVAVCAVNVSVACSQGDLDGGFDDAGRGLPGPWMGNLSVICCDVGG